ncbi:DUF4350 domain-containing protein [Lentisphaerota bacterium WC36G]|nr:hypothetical protein LJT99_04140 [Lentisphaerae bacterium WC36]
MVKQLQQIAKKNITFVFALVALVVIFTIIFNNKHEYTKTKEHFTKDLTLPYGCSILYDSLKKISVNDVSIWRDEIAEIPDFKNSTILVVGYNKNNLKDRVFTGKNDLIKAAQNGANVVFAVNSVEEEKTVEQSSLGDIKINEDALDLAGNLSQFNLLPSCEVVMEKFITQPRSHAVSQNINLKVIPFYSKYFFDDVGDFNVLYRLNGKAVVVEKKFANGGRLLLLSSSYPFTNEALKNNLQNDFLLYMLSGKKKIYFFEQHLGLKNSRNIMWLVNHYNLKLFYLMIVFAAVLFIWRNLYGVPVQDKSEDIHNKKDLLFTSPLKTLTESMVGEKQILPVIVDVLNKDYKVMRLSKENLKEIKKSLTTNDKCSDQEKYNNAVAFLNEKEGKNNG